MSCAVEEWEKANDTKKNIRKIKDIYNNKYE